MKKYLNIISKNDLFQDIKPQDIPGILESLNVDIQHVSKNSFVYLSGDPVDKIGIVLEGGLQIIKEDALGSRLLLSDLAPGDMFAEAFVCAKVSAIPVSVYASAASTILFIPFFSMIETSQTTCSLYPVLISNMMRILANKNLLLNNRIQMLSKKTTREKLMAFLSLQAERSKSKRFHIPFNRAELADFLCVDRSAMSRELSNMQKEGLLLYHKNEFELLI